MKNIKNIFKVLFLLQLIVITGCDDDDEYVAPGSFTDLFITTTAGSSAIRESEVNQFFSFSDVSAGAEVTRWTIPENTFFLKGPIPSNLPNHDKFIKEPISNVSNDKTVHIMFKKGNSDTKIGYYGVFADSTSYRYVVFNDNVADTITVSTENIEGKWVAENLFSVDVYDTVVAKPEVRYLNETILDYENTQTVTLNFDDKLIFEDLSALLDDNNARPNLTRWRVSSIEDDEADRRTIYNKTFDREGDFEKRVIDTITFNKIGEYRVELFAKRDRSENVRASEDTLLIPTIFKVIPLTEDLVAIDDVRETDDDRILIPVSSLIEPLNGNNPSGDFTVQVDGTAIPVESISLGGTTVNGTRFGVLALTLDVPLEPTDATKTVTVSYSGTSITSRDLRPLQPFSNFDIRVYVPVPNVQTGTITELSDETIQVPFDAAFDPDTFTGNPAQGFEVLVNGISFPIESVSLDASNDMTLNIKLVDPIYRPDVITISHDGSGDIKSKGNGAIGVFTGNGPVEMHDFSLITDSDFEDTIGGVTWTANEALGGMAIYSTEEVAVGTQSLKLVNPRPRLESQNEKITYVAGTYTISYKRFIPSSIDVSALSGPGDKFNVGGPNIVVRWDASGAITQGVWEDVEAEITLATDQSDAFIRIQPVPTGGDLTVYLDDFKIRLKEERP